MARRNSTQTVRDLLDAGRAIVCEHGVTKLTLDAVVKRAGLSKGAFLHHFSTKAELSSRLMQDAIDLFDAEADRNRGTDAAAGAYMRSYIRTTERLVLEQRQTEVSVIAELARESGAHDVFDASIQRWTALIESDGLDPTRAQLLRLAIDGLLLYENSGSPPMDKARRAAFLELLIAMTYENGEGEAAAADRIDRSGPD